MTPSFLIMCGIVEGDFFSVLSKFERGKIDCNGTCNIGTLRNANKLLNIDHKMCTKSGWIQSPFARVLLLCSAARTVRSTQFPSQTH